MIDGTYSILYFDVGFGFFPVGNLASNSFSEDIDTIDSTTRDNGGWKTQTLTNQSYSLDFEGIVQSTPSLSGASHKIDFYKIRELKRTKQIIDWKIEDATSYFKERGKAQMISLSNASNINEFVTFSATLQGYGSPNNNFFEFQVITSNAGTSNSNQFSLPLTSAFTGNISVDWGDGTSSNITSYNQAEVTHTYGAAGTFTIKILGAITTGWYFGASGDCLKMGDIANFGGFSCTLGAAFSGCANMTSIGSDVDFLNQATSLSQYFDNCGLTNLPSTLTLANLQYGQQMFRGNSITTLPLGMLLHNLINASLMLRGNPLTSGLPAGMILGNLTIANYMFDGCQLPNLPSTVTFANVTNGSHMLSNNSLTDLPSGVTYSNITDGTNLLLNNTINTTRYSQLLIDLENLNSNNSFSFHGGISQYNTAGQTARNILTTSPRNLTITDGGLV